MSGKSSTVINDWAEVPHFATEDEEREFWETHELGPGVLQHFRRVGAHPALESVLPAASRNISIRVEGDILRRLQVVAARRGMRYQTLLKEFVVERLYEEEKREGIIDG